MERKMVKKLLVCFRSEAVVLMDCALRKVKVKDLRFDVGAIIVYL